MIVEIVVGLVGLLSVNWYIDSVRIVKNVMYRVWRILVSM